MTNLERLFQETTGRKPTADQLVRLKRLQSGLQVGDHDTLSRVIAASEYYLALFEDLHHRTTTRTQSASNATSAWIIVSMLSAVAAIVILFGGFCVYLGYIAGAHGPASWMIPQDGSGFTHLLAAGLRAPAGWMAFLLLLPAGLTCAVAGWSARGRGARFIGWTLVASSLSILTLLAALLHTLIP